MKILVTTINSKYVHTGLGIYAVAGYLRAQNRHEVAVKEYTIQTPLLSILADIEPLAADIVGLAVYIWNKEQCLALSQMIKAVRPNCKIVLGGPEVSFNAPDILRNNPHIDYVIQGEGEQVLAQLAAAIADGTSTALDGVSGQEALSDKIAVVDNLDSLPFAYKYLNDVDMEGRILYYESSRGCPYRCSYCLSGISHRVRLRSVPSAISELQWLIDKKVKQVKFVDRTYNLTKEHYLPIMRYLAAQDTATNFHFEIKADLLTPDILEFLATVPKGRFQLEIGIQTTYAPALAAINRRNDWELLQQNIKKLLGFGNMHIHVDLIAGLPYETYAAFQQSFNDVYALGADMLQLGFLKILHGASIGAQIAEHGYKYMAVPPYEVLANNYITYPQLRRLKLIEDLTEKYYNSGLYKNVLPRILCAYPQAFDFFAEFSVFLEERQLHLQSLSTKSDLKLLLEFLADKIPENYAELVELLRLDAFVAQLGFAADLLDSKIALHNEALVKFFGNDDNIRKYCPTYRFINWRQVKKFYPMEIFELGGRERIFMLDVAQARLIEIAKEDFYRVI